MSRRAPTTQALLAALCAGCALENPRVISVNPVDDVLRVDAATHDDAPVEDVSTTDDLATPADVVLGDAAPDDATPDDAALDDAALDDAPVAPDAPPPDDVLAPPPDMPTVACGLAAQPCCTAGTSPCASGLVCVTDRCRPRRRPR